MSFLRCFFISLVVARSFSRQLFLYVCILPLPHALFISVFRQLVIYVSSSFVRTLVVSLFGQVCMASFLLCMSLCMCACSSFSLCLYVVRSLFVYSEVAVLIYVMMLRFRYFCIQLFIAFVIVFVMWVRSLFLYVDMSFFMLQLSYLFVPPGFVIQLRMYIFLCCVRSFVIYVCRSFCMHVCLYSCPHVCRSPCNGFTMQLCELYFFLSFTIYYLYIYIYIYVYIYIDICIFMFCLCRSFGLTLWMCVCIDVLLCLHLCCIVIWQFLQFVLYYDMQFVRQLCM